MTRRDRTGSITDLAAISHAIVCPPYILGDSSHPAALSALPASVARTAEPPGARRRLVCRRLLVPQSLGLLNACRMGILRPARHRPHPTQMQRDAGPFLATR